MSSTPQSVKNRRIGSMVMFGRSADFDLEPDPNDWWTICTDHQTTVSHETRRTAWSFVAVPWEWCEGCRARLHGVAEGSNLAPRPARPARPATPRQSTAIDTGAAPAWAQRLFIRIAEGEGIYGYRVKWRKSRVHPSSSGRCFYWERRIVVTAGGDRADCENTVVHEMTHALRGHDAGHPPEFYRDMFRLARAYSRLPMKQHIRAAAARTSRNARAGYRLYRRALSTKVA